MSAIIALILANLPAIISTGKAGVAWVASVRAAAKQTKEWPPEAESAFMDALIADAVQSAWRPDPK